MNIYEQINLQIEGLYNSSLYFYGFSTYKTNLLVKTDNINYYSLVALYSIVLFMFNFIIRNYIFQPLAYNLINPTNYLKKCIIKTNEDKEKLSKLMETLENEPTNENIKNDIFVIRNKLKVAVEDRNKDENKDIKQEISFKLSQSIIEALNYGLGLLMGLIVILKQDWIWPSKLWWEGYYINNSHSIIQIDLSLYYILYVARYVQATIFCLIDPKKKDFIQMCIHHIVTILLISLSYTVKCIRVGVCIMILFDIADIFLHTGKIFKYLGDFYNNYYNFIADIILYSFGVSFFITRIIIYPYICWSCWYENKNIWKIELKHLNINYEHDIYTNGILIANIFLNILLILQLMWFNYLCKKVYGIIYYNEEAEDSLEN